MNTKPITYHTMESLLARTEEIGECREWSGYFANSSPQVCHGGKMTTVRKLMRALQDKHTDGHYYGVSCGNPRCVNPDHIVGRKPEAHYRRMAKRVNHTSPVRIAKIQASARKRAVLSVELAEWIRESPQSNSACAHAVGVTKHTVGRIRGGTAWATITGNPFAQLMRM